MYKIPVVVSGNPLRLEIPYLPDCHDWRTKVLSKAIDKCSNEGAIALIKSNWGRFAVGSVATAGIAAGTLIIAPPLGAVAIAAFSTYLGKVSANRYREYRNELDPVEKELGGANNPK